MHPELTIFMCGDVMTGRGIDQILPNPSAPRMFEPYVTDAREYVELAEDANGPIPKPVDYRYIWGEAPGILERMAPDVRLINLETAITVSDDYWRKGINYRMHPLNIPAITAAGIDVCSLANNHVLDWGRQGLLETLDVLEKARIKIAGAGRNRSEAEAPAILQIKGKGRVIVFGFGSETSGIPARWAATPHAPGVNFLHDLSELMIVDIASRVHRIKQAGDIVIASIHWGGNWGYEIPPENISFAHMLIDEAGVDIVHGHSSHHVLGIEVHHGKPVIYGCGDFINDYEGIGGYEWYREDLGLMYFVQMDVYRRLLGLRMKPTRMKNLRVNRASRSEAEWLRNTLNREGKTFGTGVELDDEGTLVLLWQ